MLLPWRPISLNDGPPIPTSLTSAETDRLAELAANRYVLEIGSAYGYSTVVMALAGAIHICSVDPHVLFCKIDEAAPASSGKMMPEYLEAYGVEDRVTMVRRYSQEVLPSLVENGARFGLIFVDGDHEYDAVSHDLYYAGLLLADEGHIACHDYGETGCVDVPRAWDEFRASKGTNGLANPVDTLVVWP